MEEHRQVNRQQITIQRRCSLGVISFKQLEWTDHEVQVVDISSRGVGVESRDRMDPGFVWFRERVGGFKGGVLLWSKKQGSRYRSGIRFLPLSLDDEKGMRQSHPSLGQHRPRRSPEEILSALMKSLTQDEH